MGKYVLIAMTAGWFLAGCSTNEGKKAGSGAKRFVPGQYTLTYDVEHDDAESTLVRLMKNWARRNHFKEELILSTDSRSPTRGPQLFRKEFKGGEKIELVVSPTSTFTGTLEISLTIVAETLTDEMKRDLLDFDRRFPAPSKKKVR